MPGLPRPSKLFDKFPSRAWGAALPLATVRIIRNLTGRGESTFERLEALLRDNSPSPLEVQFIPPNPWFGTADGKIQR